ncbi:MAG: HAD family hydrolase, partial [Waddliaceae bacterium]
PFAMLEGLVSSFLDRDFETMLNPPVAGRLKEAQALGHYTVILSSSPNFLVKNIAKRFGVNEWGATEYSVTKDQTVGTVSKQMDGDDKARYVAELMQRMGISKDKITGYSDSLLDFPFLEAVGHPIAVNPGRGLRKLCLQNHWQILD